MKKQNDFITSVGALRANRNNSSNLKAPDGLGSIRLSRELIELLYHELETTGSDGVDANLAGWMNSKVSDDGERDEFVTVQISKKNSVQRTNREMKNSNLGISLFR